MRLGAPVWPFQWRPPYEEALRRIAALGFRSAELIAWDAATLADYYTPQRRRTLRALMDDLGLTLSEFVATARGMTSPDPARRQECLDHFRRVCEVARDLGTDTINTVAPAPFELPVPPLKQLPTSQIWTLDLPEGLDWERGWQEFVEMIRQVMAIVADAGLRYAIEPHPYRYVSDAASMLRLLDHVPSPALGINYDPSHTFPCGELPQIGIYRLGERVFHCHFSDNDALTNAHWRPGRGKIDWRALLAALRDVGFAGTVSIELEDVPQVARGEISAGPQFEEEMRRARDYLLTTSESLGIVWE